MSERKVAILLHSDPNDHARGLHALLYTMELEKAGIEAQLIFDGAGTSWIPLLSDPRERLHPLFEEVRKNVSIKACGFCSGAFGTTEAMERNQIPLLKEYNDHPSIAKLVQDGWDLVTL